MARSGLVCVSCVVGIDAVYVYIYIYTYIKNFFLFLPVSILALEIISLPWQSNNYCGGDLFCGVKLAILPSSAEVSVWFCDSTSYGTGANLDFFYFYF